MHGAEWRHSAQTTPFSDSSTHETWASSSEHRTHPFLSLCLSHSASLPDLLCLSHPLAGMSLACSSSRSCLSRPPVSSQSLTTPPKPGHSLYHILYYLAYTQHSLLSLSIGRLGVLRGVALLPFAVETFPLLVGGRWLHSLRGRVGRGPWGISCTAQIFERSSAQSIVRASCRIRCDWWRPIDHQARAHAA